jgi:hypothetical protein
VTSHAARKRSAEVKWEAGSVRVDERDRVYQHPRFARFGVDGLIEQCVTDLVEG